MAIRESIKNNKENFHGTKHYYQNGKEKENYLNLDTSLPMLSMYISSKAARVYCGTLDSSGNMNGNGNIFYFSFDTEDYYYANGEWKSNELAAGTAFKQESITTTSGNDWIFTYSGNIEDDMFHGDINFTWQKPDGSQYDNATIHAEHGTLDCLWEIADGYVYAQGNNSSRYWYKYSMTDLKGYTYRIY